MKELCHQNYTKIVHSSAINATYMYFPKPYMYESTEKLSMFF